MKSHYKWFVLQEVIPDIDSVHVKGPVYETREGARKYIRWYNKSMVKHKDFILKHKNIVRLVSL